MIVKKIKNRKIEKSKSWQIGDLVDYIRFPHNKNTQEKIEYAGGRNFCSTNVEEWKAYQKAFTGVPKNAEAAKNAELARMKERHRLERKNALSRLAGYGLPVLNIARHCLMVQQRAERLSLRPGRKKARGGKPRFEAWLRAQGLSRQAERWRR